MMAPRGNPKPTTTPVHHRVASKGTNTAIKTKITPNTLQEAMMTRRSLNFVETAAPKHLTVEMKAVKDSLNEKVDEATPPNDNGNQRQPLTPLKQNKPSTQPGSVTKNGKKPAWSRRPKPAHSGVPVPEKMKKLFEKLAREASMHSTVEMKAVKDSLNEKVDEATPPNDNGNQRQPLTPLKQNKPSTQPGSVTKNGKKPAWSRRPKPAHSGVPVPEKMKKLFEKLAREGKQL